MRFLNLPWTFTRRDLARYLAKTLDTRVRYTRILYSKETGLSRGVGLAAIPDQKRAMDMITRGELEIEGRNIVVLRDTTRDGQPRVNSKDEVEDGQ